MISIVFTLGLVGAEIPQIPFSVVDPTLGRTIHVNASCKADNGAMVLFFDADTAKIGPAVFSALKVAFATNGVTKLSICRKDNI
jgi:hypothetical protein